MGSSKIYIVLPVDLFESSLANFILCASPPDSVVACCPIFMYPKPTFFKVSNFDLTLGIFSKKVHSRAIDNLLRKRPDVQISVIENNFDALAKALMDGEIDIMLGPSLAGKRTPGLKTEVLAETEVVFTLRAEHPLAELDYVSLGKICEADWILPTPQTRAVTFFDSLFIDEGYAPPKGPIIMPPGPAAIALLKRRNLITMMSRDLIIHELTSGELKVLPISNNVLTLPLQLTTREFGKLGPACREMISEIRGVSEETTTGVHRLYELSKASSSTSHSLPSHQ